MLWRLGVALLCAAGASVLQRANAATLEVTHCDVETPSNVSLHSFTFKDILQEHEVPFHQFRGKVVLAVNVATYCGLTWTYHQLNALQTRFRERNFTVLGFPCNQFGKQEPGSGQEILNGIRYVRPGNNYIPNFPMLEKIEVNGENQHPLFAYLNNRCPSPRTKFAKREKLFYDPLDNSDIRWNFEKFLIDTAGKPRIRYSPSVLPFDATKDIEQLLEQCGL